MNRAEKIRILKDLANGKGLPESKSLQDMDIWLLGDGIATNLKTGHHITEEEYINLPKAKNVIAFR